MKHFYYFLYFQISFFLLIYSTPIFSTVGNQIPPSVQYKLRAKPAVIEMPPLDSVKAGICYNCLRNTKLKSLPFALNFDVNLTPANSGLWQNLSDGNKLWIEDIHSKGAFSMGLVFAGLHLPHGHEVYVYNPNDPNSFEHFTSKDVANEIFVTMPVVGQTIRVEYLIPQNTANKASLQIVKVSHAYLDIFKSKLKSTGYGASGSCNIDINCPEGARWQKDKNAVVNLYITQAGGDVYCSGVLVNNTANDGTPYLLTANHCIETYSDAEGTLFYFGYESPFCQRSNGPYDKMIRGSQLKATSDKIDFTLVKLDSILPIRYFPYYAGWNHSDQTGDSVTPIHHPEGDVKKISFDYSQPIHDSYPDPDYLPGAFWHILQWNVGTTEPGSSGCPLFDHYHRVIGTLTGGSAVCGNAIDDYFERFGIAWDYYSDSTEQLKCWLDPLGKNQDSIGSFDPNDDFKSSCDTFTNISRDESLALLPFDNGKGYYSGQNSDSINSFAEYFEVSDSMYVNGLFMNIARNNFTGNDSIGIFINEINGDTFIERYRMNVSLASLSSGIAFVDIYPAVLISKNILFGYTIQYNSFDTFAVYNANKRFNGSNTAYVFHDNQWQGINEISIGGYGTSFDIRPLICGKELPMKIQPVQKYTGINVFPSPAVNSFIYIWLPTQDSSSAKVDIFNVSGKIVYSAIHNTDDIEIGIPINNWSSGVYIARVITDKNTYTRKFLVRK